MSSTYVTKLDYLEDTKDLIKQAIIDKGVSVSDSDTFRDYADKIAEIETGGGGGEIPRGTPLTRDDFPLSNAVKERRIKAPFTFYDYDGTVLGQYTKAQIDAMTSEDDFPTPVGNNIGDGIDQYPLTLIGWNWTLDELKEQPYGINVGAIYAHILEDGTQSPCSVFMNVTEEVTFRMGNNSAINLHTLADIYNRATGELVTTVELRISNTAVTLPIGKYEVRLKGKPGYESNVASDKVFPLTDNAVLPYIEGISIGDTYRCGNTTTPFVSGDTNVKFVCCNATYGNYILPLRHFTCDHFNHNKMSSQIELCNCKVTSFNTKGTLYIKKGERLEELLVPSNVYRINTETALNMKELYIPSNVFIPSKIEGIEYIYLEDGVKGSFPNDSKDLKEIYIPDSITTVNFSAFGESLQKIRLGNATTSVSANSDYRRILIESIYLPDTLTQIGGWAFAQWENLKTLYVPDSVTSIGDGAFYCTKLTPETLRLPKGVSISPKNTFANTPARTPYKDLNITGSTSFSMYSGCFYLEGDIEVPEGMIDLNPAGANASITYVMRSGIGFLNCRYLSKVILPASITSLTDNAFQYCTGLEEVVLGENTTKIGKNAFQTCLSLTTINIPQTVTTISGSAFSYCRSLKEITIPDSVTSLGSGYTDGDIFSNCLSLEKITLSNNLTSIGNSCFNSCTSLQTITIPATVTDMNGSSIFSSCSKLTEYHMKPTTPPTLHSSVFGYGSSLPNTSAKIYVPYSEDHSILAAYQSATNWSKYANYIVEEEI